jgi:hypothetical protein
VDLRPGACATDEVRSLRLGHGGSLERQIWWATALLTGRVTMGAVALSRVHWLWIERVRGAGRPGVPSARRDSISMFFTGQRCH